MRAQGANSPTYQDMIDPAEDKTHIEENLEGDLSPHLGVRVEAEDDALMPVDGMATATSIEEGREGQDEAADGGKSEPRLSEVDLPRDRTEVTRDSTDPVSTSPPVAASAATEHVCRTFRK